MTYQMARHLPVFNGLEQKTGSVTLILLHKASVGQHRRELIRKNALKKRYQITLLYRLHELNSILTSENQHDKTQLHEQIERPRNSNAQLASQTILK